jgi:glycosyltransferase involved in cell wall biosynthesis
MLAPEPPYPLAGGGALRTASLLHYLANRYAVDLVVFRQPGAADTAGVIPQGLLRNVTSIALPRHGKSFAVRSWRNLGRLARGVPPLIDRFAGFETAVSGALVRRRYAVGVIEHSWCAAYLPQIAACCERTVLDLHNIESALHAGCAEVERGGIGLAHRLFQQASLEWERNWLPRFSMVLAASEADRHRIARIAPAARVTVYPNTVPLVPLPQVVKEEVVVFSGNLEYHPNYAAVRFFRTAIWPALRERFPSLVWRLVGKAPEAVAALVAGDSRIELTGPVEDAVHELARARVAVVPLLSGSGTRLKIVEAWAAGLPVVSTTIGAEGLPGRAGEHLLLADSPAEFAAAVSRLLTCEELRENLGAAGRRLCEEECTWYQAWRRLSI